MNLTPQVIIAIVTIVGLLGFLSLAVWSLARLAARDDRFREAFLQLTSPVSIVATLILLGVLFILGMAILDLDKGRVLIGMGRTPFARGLITYLFAIVTIGTAVLLVVSALLGTAKDRFDSGKEVLGLLLGVFGTIVGFYFASELSELDGSKRLTVSSVLASPVEVTQGSSLTVTVAVQGGSAPYRFEITLAEELSGNYPQLIRPDGWIVKEVTVTEETPVGIQPVRVGVLDARGESTMVQTLIEVQPQTQTP
ncbi:hypothetical protein WJR50_33720 [Catalinimonas sp. 4WD22]|uniref:hypothetical protein n=1 Tax=Catalinimonas locisalis TaxID=3133978 RepID=UPI003100B889